MERNKTTCQIAMVKGIAFAVTLCGLYSCKFLCGDLSDDQRNRLNKVEKNYGRQVSVEVIPCESRYVNIKLKVRPDIVPLDSVHMLLYDKETHNGWETLIVNDVNDKYLFSHSSDNKIYKQKGD